MLCGFICNSVIEISVVMRIVLLIVDMRLIFSIVLSVFGVVVIGVVFMMSWLSLVM